MMNITFSSDKKCECYKAYVEDPTNRTALRNFNREYCMEIQSAALRLHKRLKASENAHMYNKVSGIDNSIEILKNQDDNESLILKVRVNGAYRKFFHYIPAEADDFLIVKHWEGEFDKVTDLHVFEVNKHDYKKINKK